MQTFIHFKTPENVGYPNLPARLDMRKQYFESLSANDSSPPTSDVLFEFRRKLLLAESGDTKLYTYCPINTANEVMKSKSLLLQSPDKFNDPFDCLANASFMYPWNNRARNRFHNYQLDREHVRQEVSKLPNKFQPKNFDSLRLEYFPGGPLRFAVKCLTTDRYNPLMWSHYGDHHKGVCFEYDFNSFGNDLHPCYYTSDYAAFSDTGTSLGLALIKNPAWAYEKEWRVVHETNVSRSNLMGAAMQEVGELVRSDPALNESERFEWSKIVSDYYGELNDGTQKPDFLSIAPSRVFLGARLNISGGDETHQSFFQLLRESKIPWFPLAQIPDSFGLTVIDPYAAENSFFRGMDLGIQARINQLLRMLR